MNPANQHIDDLFRREMEGHVEPPPSAVWDALEERLDKKQRRRGAWLWMLGALLLLTLLMGACLLLAHRIHSEKGSSRPVNQRNAPIKTAYAGTHEAQEISPKATKRLLYDCSDTTILPRKRERGALWDTHVQRQVVLTHSSPLRSASLADSRGEHPVNTKLEMRKSGDEKTQERRDTCTGPVAAAHTRTFEHKLSPKSRLAVEQATSVPDSTKTSDSYLVLAARVSGESHSTKGSGRKRRLSPVVQSSLSVQSDEPNSKPNSPSLSWMDSDSLLREATEQQYINQVPGQLIASVKSDTTETIASAVNTSPDWDTIAPFPFTKRNRQRGARRRAPLSGTVKNPVHTADAGTHLFSKDTGTTLSLGARIPLLKGTSSADSQSLLQGNSGSRSGLEARGQAPPDKGDPPVPKVPFYFRVGVQAGVESALSAFRANKTVLDVFFEWTAFGSLGLRIAPAIKWAQTNQEYTLSDGSYIRSGAPEKSYFDQESDSMGGFTGYASYAFVQRYDSIVAQKTLGRSYRELELPLSLFVHLTKNWSLSGGLNLVWGSAPRYTGSLRTNANLILRDTVLRYWDTSFTGPSPAAKFSHPGMDSFARYKDPASDPVWKPFRYGYTFAVKYTHRYGVNAELSVRQQLGGLSAAPDAQMKALLRQTYFRFTLGYELGRSKNKSTAR